ncbi:methylamine utilization protein [Motiliproteus coralliicola]|uniref:Methylamine utilization protein n=1 Tax=Motiliproteus coralliicola TaxID=2283196 RepID=A0A369WEZ0_9GAMM|nr:methylamine utilization protein [Motiliproteus coralliicola]
MVELLCLTTLLSASFAHSGSQLQVRVLDDGQSPLENAVISLVPLFEHQPASVPGEALVKQQGAQFRPFVQPVQVGTKVSFPNFDDFRHHVYSFSKAKRFQLQLYGQDESKSIVFDKPGVIALGCNIHDNMLAFVYVTDHPFYSLSGDDGTVSFDDLPAGTYKVYAWHPDIKGRTEVEISSIELVDGEPQSLDAELILKSARSVQYPPDENGNY